MSSWIPFSSGFTQTPWCWPVIIYAILLLVTIVLTLFNPQQTVTARISSAIAGIVVGLLWLYLMMQLCGRDHAGWSWFILLLPVIIMFVLVALVYAGFAFGAGLLSSQVKKK